MSDKGRKSVNVKDACLHAAVMERQLRSIRAYLKAACNIV